MTANRLVVFGMGLSILVGAGRAQAQQRQGASVPVPITGRTVDIRVAGGARLSGELIEASDDQLLLLGLHGLSTVPLSDVARIEYQRHDFGASKAFLWVGLGAVVTGAGMSAACTQVSDGCGGVFLGMVVSWTVIGGLLAASVASGRMQALEPDGAVLRPYARFPQGAPAGFADAVGRDPGGVPR